MKQIIRLLLIFAFCSCSSKTERLAEHFRNNKQLYEQLRKEIELNQKGLLRKPHELSEEARVLSEELPLKLNYLATDIKFCDSTQTMEIELIFESNIYLNYNGCQPENSSELTNLEIIELDANWVIWREKDFI